MFPSVCLILFASVLLSACTFEEQAVVPQALNIQWQETQPASQAAVSAALRQHGIVADAHAPSITLSFTQQPMKHQQDISFSMQRWKYCLQWTSEKDSGRECLTITHLANEQASSQEASINFLVSQFLAQSSSTASNPSACKS